MIPAAYPAAEPPRRSLSPGPDAPQERWAGLNGPQPPRRSLSPGPEASFGPWAGPNGPEPARRHLTQGGLEAPLEPRAETYGPVLPRRSLSPSPGSELRADPYGPVPPRRSLSPEPGYGEYQAGRDEWEQQQLWMRQQQEQQQLLQEQHWRKEQQVQLQEYAADAGEMAYPSAMQGGYYEADSRMRPPTMQRPSSAGSLRQAGPQQEGGQPGRTVRPATAVPGRKAVTVQERPKTANMYPAAGHKAPPPAAVVVAHPFSGGRKTSPMGGNPYALEPPTPSSVHPFESSMGSAAQAGSQWDDPSFQWEEPVLSHHQMAHQQQQQQQHHHHPFAMRTPAPVAPNPFAAPPATRASGQRQPAIERQQGRAAGAWEQYEKEQPQQFLAPGSGGAWAVKAGRKAQPLSEDFGYAPNPFADAWNPPGQVAGRSPYLGQAEAAAVGLGHTHDTKKLLSRADLVAAKQAEIGRGAVAGAQGSRLIGGNWKFVEEEARLAAAAATGGRGSRGAVFASRDLTSEDLARTRDLLLGQHVVPGSANARLVGGRWRYVPDELPEEPMFTE